MPDLERKFVKELAADARVLACRFPLPSLRVTREIDEGIDSVWQYDSINTGSNSGGGTETASTSVANNS